MAETLAFLDADTWDEVEWPEWVPEKVRGEIERFWGCFGRTPRHYATDCERPYGTHHDFGEDVSVWGDGLAYVCPVGCRPKERHPYVGLGRFVHAWNNIGRVVLPDGSHRVCSSHGPQFYEPFEPGFTNPALEVLAEATDD